MAASGDGGEDGALKTVVGETDAMEADPIFHRSLVPASILARVLSVDFHADGRLVFRIAVTSNAIPCPPPPPFFNSRR